MGRRKDVSKMPKDIRELVNLISRSAAVEIMNDLAEKGPEWTGKFKNSWVAEPAGSASGGGAGSYPYTLNNVPEIPPTVRETARAKKFSIENTQPYAAYALDLEQGVFWSDKEPVSPEKVVAEGKRLEPGFRGDVSGDGNSRSTAPLDWYSTYVNGAMKDALRRGVTFAFKAKQ